MPSFIELGRRFFNSLGITTPGQHQEAFQARLQKTSDLIGHLREGGTLGREGEEEALEKLRSDPEFRSFVEEVDKARGEQLKKF